MPYGPPACAVARAVALVPLLAACAGLTPLERLKRQAEQQQGRVLVARLKGGTRVMLLKGCELFLVDLASADLRRERVLRPDVYPFASCFDQRIEQRGDEVRVFLLMRALGSGGGNQGGGTYRSGDGRHWQRLDFRRTAAGWAERWTPLP